MYEKIEECPICQGNEFKGHLICTDHTVSKESFAITQCSNCELLITNPRPSIATLNKYYESENYISHQNKSTNPINIIYKLARNYTLSKKYKLISKLNTPKTILDYGCGTGHFLEYFNAKGWNIQGIEPSETARRNSKQIPVVESLNKVDPTVDIITLWHVLEHIHNPNEILQQLKQKLNKNGYLILALPNPNSYDAKIYKENWAAYDVPRHLFHYTQQTIKALLHYNGFKLTNTVPLKLDAYYISLLSESIKGNKNPYLQAIINGYRSNKQAKKDNYYSSLIYIIQKK